MAKTNNELRIDFLEIVIVLSRWKRTMVVTTTLAVAGAVLYALLTAREYTAQAVVVPKEDNIDVVSSFIKNMPTAKSQLKGNIFSPATDIENVYIAILKSKMLQLQVIRKFDLPAVYEFKKSRYYIEDVLRAYNRHVTSSLSDEGMLVIDVVDKSPQRAAEIANYIVGVMDEMYGNLAAEAAKNRRIFLGERLRIIKHDLTCCEDSLILFQTKNRIADVEQQAKATIDVGAIVEAKLLAVELDLNIARKAFTPDNQKVKEMEMSLAEMKKQRNVFSDVRESDLLLPLKLTPQIAGQFYRYQRNLKIQEVLFELVMQQYEAAKLEETRNTPHVQILDKADPPQKRSKPKRTRIVIAVFFISILLNFVCINLIEIYRRMRRDNTESYRKMVMIMNNILAFKR
jgi:tyrosine-protein kinase Etk/Wzc